jgi:uncharacterized metal-binding protein YceD (DUF177 family)
LVPVTALRRQPGTRREERRVGRIGELQVAGSVVPAGAEAVAVAVLDSILGGIEVAADIRAPWQGECRRCLRPVSGELHCKVRELYRARDSEGGKGGSSHGKPDRHGAHGGHERGEAHAGNGAQGGQERQGGPHGTPSGHGGPGEQGGPVELRATGARGAGAARGGHGGHRQPGGEGGHGGHRHADVDLDEETYPLVGDQLDLRPLVRDALLLELPLAPLCREDCRGLCAQCGTDLNSGPCECEPARDPRWNALDALRGAPEDDGSGS